MRRKSKVTEKKANEWKLRRMEEGDLVALEKVTKRVLHCSALRNMSPQAP